MNGSDLFNIWAPYDSIWSRWAKPVLFAEMGEEQLAGTELGWPQIEIEKDEGTAMVVDLPGDESVRIGMALALGGYRPVPLFNSASGMSNHSLAITTVNVGPIQKMLVAGSVTLAKTKLPPKARPVFLLDSNRAGTSFATPGKFDNRSVVFPQDFPSANFLAAQGISRVVLFQKGGLRQPAADLAHVLLRWQDAKIQIYSYDRERSTGPEPLSVNAPSHFKMLWQRTITALGLRRSSAGGFGSIVPEPSSSSGYS